MTLRPAYLLADRIRAELASLCEAIEIAGSIRRARETVNDIDIVILPKPDAIPAIKDRCLRKCSPVTDGHQNFIVRFPPTGPHANLQLDIFFARPTTTDWGSLLLCRTGSREHNIWIAERALAMGLKWNPYKGLFGPSTIDGPLDKLIASETEQDILTALNLEWIPPVMREIS